MRVLLVPPIHVYFSQIIQEEKLDTDDGNPDYTYFAKHHTNV